MLIYEYMPNKSLDFYIYGHGYVPPEYVRKGIYSMKYDVYTFGVLLLQIISGKRSTCYYGADENWKYVSDQSHLFQYMNA
ncbi:hypothetical protein POTOM_057500 [Populus tomentosa]|uniref:Serine-threonine/tyrosine-protein kinase catalytic domain-containing protein n=1 Tax=Populus tomentosa TaxID=118781 RepID=A0A8X8C3H3_POPTO|nr:hypothetical protein POTOM_057500 [Populus tomentosa]